MTGRPPGGGSGWSGAPPYHSDAALMAGAGLAGYVFAVGWAGMELAGWSAGGRWPDVPAGDVPAALARAAAHPGSRLLLSRPARVPTLDFYGWVGLLLAGSALLLVVLWGLWLRLPARRPGGAGRRARPGRGRSTGPPGAVRDWSPGGGERWANPADLRSLLLRPGRWSVRPGRRSARLGGAGRLVLGRFERKVVATEARHSVLVFGPTQSGKTTGLAIPALLEWEGPVVATSVKADLVASTAAWRSGRGPCCVFDPTQSSGTGPLARWSPLPACGTWSGAQKVASCLVEGTPGRSGLSDAAFWYASAAKQLAPLLIAAEKGGFSMADVVRWTNTSDFAEPGTTLQLFGEAAAGEALAACAGRDERIRSSVATTLETVLGPFEDPLVAVSTAVSDFDVTELIATGGTLYLCGPSHEQERVQGLFSALVSTVVAEAVHRAGRAGGPLDPPLLLVLDEAANIAPVRDLDTLASTGAGLGIQLVTVCQDLSQLARRYDPARARTIVNNHRAKLLLSGVSDIETLDLISGLAGEQAVREESATHDLRDGRRTRSTSTVMRRLAPTSELRRTPPGQAVLLYGHLPPARLALRPWYLDRRLRERAGPA